MQGVVVSSAAATVSTLVTLPVVQAQTGAPRQMLNHYYIPATYKTMH
jgi:hypothetical protein